MLTARATNNFWPGGLILATGTETLLIQELDKTALAFEGVNAGIFLGSCLIEQAARTLSSSDWLAYKQAKERVFGPVMPAYFGLTLILSIIATVLSDAAVNHALSTLLLTGALIITVAVHLPLNTRFERWQPTTMPGDWDKDRTRWRNWNWVRGLLALMAFTFVVFLV